MPRLAPTLVASATVVALLAAACCPVSAPPTTAFVAHLTPLGSGMARADLPDGSHTMVRGVDGVPAGDYYVTGTLRADGTVVTASIEPVPATSGGGRAP